MKKKLYRYLTLLIFASCLSGEFSGCESTSTLPDQSEHWLTVFVHGIINIQPHLTPANIIRFWHDQIEDSVYTHAVELIRKDPYFQQFHAMQGLGLQKINPDEVIRGNAAHAFASVYDIISAQNNDTTTTNHYYTFGWTGLLSRRMRVLEAEILYNALLKEVADYQKMGINPKVRVIGYSHGGILTVNLGGIHDTKQHPEAHVDELILIGTPIFEENYGPITSQLFKKIYHFYSPGDRVQPIDVFSGSDFFSGRTFEPCKGFKVPANLKQIELRMKRIANRNPFKIHRKFHKRLLRNADPGHTELWSFGWVFNYRQYLPWYPLPAASFLGYLVNAIECYLPNSTHISTHILPYKETLILWDQKTGKRRSTPFLKNSELDALRSIALQFEPKECKREIFNQKVEDAIELAEKKYRQKIAPDNCYCASCGKKIGSKAILLIE